MKIVAIGDIHGHDTWKSIVEKEKDADTIVFLGDYFDSFNVPTGDQIFNFLEIIHFKQTTPKKVVLLIGNHDHHYLPGIGDSGTSGYQPIGGISIETYLQNNLHHLQMAYQEGELLFTHAGVCSTWMDNNFQEWKAETIADQINDLFKYKPKYPFLFNGINGYGDDIGQTPIWIRPKSLMMSNRDTLRNKVIQIVGHTGQKSIDIEGKSTGGRYFFIDTLEVGQYLIIEDGEFKLGTV